MIPKLWDSSGLRAAFLCLRFIGLRPVGGKLLPDIVHTQYMFGDMTPSYMCYGQLERVIAGCQCWSESAEGYSRWVSALELLGGNLLPDRLASPQDTLRQ